MMNIVRQIGFVLATGFFVQGLFGQPLTSRQAQILRDDGSSGAQMRYKAQMDADKDDIWWGKGDWRYRELNRAHAKNFGHVRHEPKDMYEWLDDTRQTFAKARRTLVSVGSQKYLDACQKRREAGIILEACYAFHDPAMPEVCRAAYTGPFFGLRGRRDDQTMVQIFFVKAYDLKQEADKEYYKVFRATKHNDVVDAMVALMKARGKDYAVRRWEIMRGKGVFFHEPLSDEFIYGGVAPGNKFESPGPKEAPVWKAIFANLSWQESEHPGRPVPAAVRSAPPLLLEQGMGLGSRHNPMITRDEFMFIWRQADHCWKEFLNPPKELREDLPRYTYWALEAGPGEPELVLRVAVPRGPGYHPPWGSAGQVFALYHLPHSLLKGFCSEWKQELVSYQASLSREGVGQDQIDDWNGIANMKVWENGKLIRPSSVAEDAWRMALNRKEEELCGVYFPKQRLRLTRLSDEQEYERRKSVQDEWQATHSSPSFQYKLNLCAAFEVRAPRFSDGSTLSGSSSRSFSLPSLETFRPSPAIAVSSK